MWLFMPLLIQSSLFLLPEKFFLIPLHLLKILVGGDTSPRSTWITHLDSWYSAQCCVLVDWEYSSYLIISLNLFPGSIVKSGASQYSSFKDLVSPSETCLYGHINLSLAQVQQKSSFGLYQSSPSMTSGRTTQFAVFSVYHTKAACGRVSWGLCCKEVSLWHWDRVIRMAGSPLMVMYLILRGRESHGGWCSWYFTVYNLTPSSSVVQVGTVPYVWVSGETLLLIGLHFIWLKATSSLQHGLCCSIISTVQH